MNTYVTHSDRYRGWAVVHGDGRQAFGESGRPLVYDNREDAHAAVRLIWAGVMGGVK